MNTDEESRNEMEKRRKNGEKNLKTLTKTPLIIIDANNSEDDHRRIKITIRYDERDVLATTNVTNERPIGEMYA